MKELELAKLQENEWEILSQQHQKIHNAKSLVEKLIQTMDLTVLNKEISASMLLQQAIDRINEIKIQDPQLIAIREMLNTPPAVYLQEAGTELNHYCEQLDLSAEKLETMKFRLSLLHDLARKHHISPEELIDVKKSLYHRIKIRNS